MIAPPEPRRSPLRAALLAVIAVSLVLLGGGLAVALGLGRDPAPVADSVDAGFARDMSRHHLQGVEMANLALERTEDPEIRSLAFDISSTQTNQAGRMEGWLSLWGLQSSGGEVMAWMSDDGGHAGHSMDMGEGGLMPGMATEDELAGLREPVRAGVRRRVPAADDPAPPGRPGHGRVRGRARRRWRPSGGWAPPSPTRRRPRPRP